MKKVVLSQSIKVVKEKDNDYTYQVKSLVGTTHPAIGETLSRKDVKALCNKPGLTVEIKESKKR